MNGSTDIDDAREYLADALRHAADLFGSALRRGDQAILAEEAADLFLALRCAERSLMAAQAPQRAGLR